MGELATTDQQPGTGTNLVVDEANQYLTFHVQGESLAIGILDVKEIIEVGVMTRVPMTPDFIQGVINLRGNVVPVINLGSRLGRGRCPMTRRSCIVLVECEVENSDRQTIGMLVDEVNEILEIRQDCMQPPPDFGTDIRIDFIQRMARVDEQFIALLDIGHVLSMGELAQYMLPGGAANLPAATAEAARGAD
ncbi:MAG: chemotaxis protein CheW [Gammaproteobacteria bacterium SHHR-1]|uniref:chemotaxis protein CheW n=1 Tax=Magnetovirga frankeli TaxID=947516 RepID=UPI0012938A8A|nr:purine-binding chemotaxis protein CheW [gamma proteobacterium SS-5]